MILYPAIDLKEGACVRLVRGEMASATVFNRDPTAQACHFAESGFAWLHVVDLDGAVAGRSVNAAAGDSAIEVDDVQPGKAGLCEMMGLRLGIPVENGGTRHFAADQADAGAIL